MGLTNQKENIKKFIKNKVGTLSKDGDAGYKIACSDIDERLSELCDAKLQKRLRVDEQRRNKAIKNTVNKQYSGCIGYTSKCEEEIKLQKRSNKDIKSKITNKFKS